MKTKPKVKGVNSTEFCLHHKPKTKPTDSRSEFSLEKKAISKGSRMVNQPDGFEFGSGRVSG